MKHIMLLFSAISYLGKSLATQTTEASYNTPIVPSSFASTLVRGKAFYPRAVGLDTPTSGTGSSGFHPPATGSVPAPFSSNSQTNSVIAPSPLSTRSSVASFAPPGTVPGPSVPPSPPIGTPSSHSGTAPQSSPAPTTAASGVANPTIPIVIPSVIASVIVSTVSGIPVTYSSYAAVTGLTQPVLLPATTLDPSGSIASSSASEFGSQVLFATAAVSKYISAFDNLASKTAAINAVQSAEAFGTKLRGELGDLGGNSGGTCSSGGGLFGLIKTVSCVASSLTKVSGDIEGAEGDATKLTSDVGELGSFAGNLPGGPSDPNGPDQSPSGTQEASNTGPKTTNPPSASTSQPSQSGSITSSRPSASSSRATSCTASSTAVDCDVTCPQPTGTISQVSTSQSCTTVCSTTTGCSVTGLSSTTTISGTCPLVSVPPNDDYNDDGPTTIPASLSTLLTVTTGTAKPGSSPASVPPSSARPTLTGSPPPSASSSHSPSSAPPGTAPVPPPLSSSAPPASTSSPPAPTTAPPPPTTTPSTPTPTIPFASPPISQSCYPVPTTPIRDAHYAIVTYLASSFCGSHASAISTSAVSAVATQYLINPGSTSPQDDVYEFSITQVDGCVNPGPGGGFFDPAQPIEGAGGDCVSVFAEAWRMCVNKGRGGVLRAGCLMYGARTVF